jgi:hypothetical protein
VEQGDRRAHYRPWDKVSSDSKLQPPA